VRKLLMARAPDIDINIHFRGLNAILVMKCENSLPCA